MPGVAYPYGNGRTAHVRFTTVADGDLRVTQPAVGAAAARARIRDRPWTWLHQVHGADVVVVGEPGEHAGADADAAVTTVPGATLAIHTADCVPLALLAPEAVGAVHAGWRGVESGVVETAVGRLRELGASDVAAVIGPCIHPECYEFGAEELALVEDRYGPSVRGTTSTGRLALDMPAAVRAALTAAGVAQVEQIASCTACDQEFFSHRARGDVGRQAMLVWLESA